MAEFSQPSPMRCGDRQRVVIAPADEPVTPVSLGRSCWRTNAGLAVDVEYSSEYMYRSTHTLHDPGVVVISQSGETADTLASLREAKVRGLATVAIVNDPNIDHGARKLMRVADDGRQRSGRARDEKASRRKLTVLYCCRCFWRG